MPRTRVRLAEESDGRERCTTELGSRAVARSICLTSPHRPSVILHHSLPDLLPVRWGHHVHCSEKGIVVKKKAWEFLKKKVTYIGCGVSKEGIKVEPGLMEENQTAEYQSYAESWEKSAASSIIKGNRVW
ncbi:hypothetical protein NDU88_005074 [Pleurodeles waltl]|uniref:Uncharacterized protein n=1 Tax=Pleurodeles waltl TaxID=8319 RepID=A0AAV7TAL1_PLEWA|nr:hypothetical protein NDU88_005074 [Pleurodeles waltl]